MNLPITPVAVSSNLRPVVAVAGGFSKAAILYLLFQYGKEDTGLQPGHTPGYIFCPCLGGSVEANCKKAHEDMIDLVTQFSHGFMAALRRTQSKLWRGYCRALSIFPRVDAVEGNLRPGFL